MAVSPTQQFILGGSTVTLQAPDPGSLNVREQKIQNTVNSASGGVFVDDKAVTRYYVSFTVTLTQAQAVALTAFYDDDADGRLNTFTWLDHKNRTWASVRFDMDSLEYTRTQGNKYTYTIQLRASAGFGV